MIEALFEAALQRHRAGRPDEAAGLYRRVLAIDPRHADSLHLLGVIAAQSGRHGEAAALIGRAVAISPDFALAHFNRGNALRALERHAEAVEAFGRAARLDPRHAASQNNLGAALRALGRCDEAVDAYRRASALKPDDPDVCYNLGVALGELRRDEEAAAAYRRALALKPDHVDALINLGVALQALGRDAEALDAFRRAVAVDPLAADAHAGIGGVLQARGRFEAALLAYRRALELKPDEAAAHIRLGFTLHALGRPDEALAAYRRAIALRSDDAEAHVGAGVALQELGRSGEAAAAVERALALDPASARAWYIRSDLKTFAPDDPDIARMEALLAGADARRLDPDARLDLEFALGKAWMDVGEADRAFAHLTAGNRRVRGALAYDVEADVSRFAAVARTFTPELMDRLGGAGFGDERPLFIVGMPRSGTTLVEQILASHPQIHGAGELGLLDEVVGRAWPRGFPPSASDLAGADLSALGRAYAERVGALAPGSRRVVDKMPSNFPFAGLIALMLPGARILHCRRDPVDTCLSCYSKRFAGRWDFAYDLGDLGRYYRAYDALMAHWRALLPSERFAEVRYEELVGNLRGEAERLIAFCGLAWDDACLDFHRTVRPVRTASVNQVRQPIYRTSLARWKPYAAHLGPLLAALGLAA